jgi:hypothetical protein
MRAKKSQSKNQQPVGPIYKAIKAKAAAAPAAEDVRAQPANIQPGEIGEAAIAAATLRQLNRYAEDVQQFLNASKLRMLVNRIQADVSDGDLTARPRMRLRRE